MAKWVMAPSWKRETTKEATVGKEDTAFGLTCLKSELFVEITRW